MKKLFVILGCAAALNASAQVNPGYRIVKTFTIKSGGGWDYLAVNNGKIYVSHGTQVNILNEDTGDSVGFVPNTNGVHGIAFDNALQRGYTSNGRSNNVTVFNLATNEAVAQVVTGENPDAILYDPFSKTIVTCNGRGKNLSVIDPSTNSVVSTIDVGGKPETAVTDGKGKLFVNVEDKNEIVAVDMKTRTVLHHWSIAPGDGPTGLAFDKATNRLFAGCDKLMVVVNAETGAVVTTVKIGDGCDGVAFDAKKKLVFTSNGEGTLSVIKEVSADKYALVGNYDTKRGARTIAIDEAKNTIFLPTADFEAPVAPATRPRMIPGTFQVLVVQ